jgi:hypothetical protein
VLGIVDGCAMMAPHGAPKSDRFGEEASTAATIPFLGAIICTSALCGPESASPGTAKLTTQAPRRLREKGLSARSRYYEEFVA